MASRHRAHVTYCGSVVNCESGLSPQAASASLCRRRWIGGASLDFARGTPTSIRLVISQHQPKGKHGDGLVEQLAGELVQAGGQGERRGRAQVGRDLKSFSHGRVSARAGGGCA